jgi:general secretion pathway protein D
MNYISPLFKTASGLVLFLFAFAWMAPAQEPTPPPEPAFDPAPAGQIIPTEPTASPAPAIPSPSPAALQTAGTIRMNFQGAAVSDVLNHLSEAAGFVIVQETPVTGTVNVVSRQPVTRDEAVDLVNAVLAEKGFTALRNGRILKIVSRKDALRRDLRVISGSDPAQIPRKDEMVTQILPVRYVEAPKLIDNLRPLLAPDATITSNESSNAILLTDTQANVRRVAEIIRALDTSVSGISTIRVFQLQYADSKQLATVVTQLFSMDAAGGPQGQQQQGGRGRPRGGFAGFAGFAGFGGQPAQPQSAARQAASRVVAVADEPSNSLIVSAPDEVMPTIAEIVQRIDVSTVAVSETRIFRLIHADSMELAAIVTQLFGDATALGAQNRRGQPQQPQNQPAQATRSERALQQARVVAVADPRTNSLVVTASRESMMQIAETVGRLDQTDAKKQRVFMHSLEHADAENVAAVLRGMFGDQSVITRSGAQSGTSRLSERAATGASTEATAGMNSGGTRANR